MSIENIIDDAILQHEIHLRNIFESFVGRRFQSLKELQVKLQIETKEKIVIYISETDADFLHDYQLDGEIGNENEFSIFYLSDRKGLMYITEISF